MPSLGTTSVRSQGHGRGGCGSAGATTCIASFLGVGMPSSPEQIVRHLSKLPKPRDKLRDLVRLAGSIKSENQHIMKIGYYRIFLLPAVPGRKDVEISG